MKSKPTYKYEGKLYFKKLIGKIFLFPFSMRNRRNRKRPTNFCLSFGLFEVHTRKL